MPRRRKTPSQSSSQNASGSSTPRHLLPPGHPDWEPETSAGPALQSAASTSTASTSTGGRGMRPDYQQQDRDEPQAEPVFQTQARDVAGRLAALEMGAEDITPQRPVQVPRPGQQQGRQQASDGASSSQPAMAFGPRREARPGEQASSFGRTEPTLVHDQRIMTPQQHLPNREQAGSNEESTADAAWKETMRAKCNNVLHMGRENSQQQIDKCIRELELYRLGHRGSEAIFPNRPKTASRLQRYGRDQKCWANFYPIHLHGEPLFNTYKLTWIRTDNKRMMKDDNQKMWLQLLNIHGRDEHGMNGVVSIYDGASQVMAGSPYAWPLEELRAGVTLVVVKPGSGAVGVRARLKLEDDINSHDLTPFLDISKSAANFPRGIVSAANLILKEYCRLKGYTESGRYFFATENRDKKFTHDLLDLVTGFFQSVRALRIGLVLNVDVTKTVFYKEDMLLAKAWNILVNKYVPLATKQLFTTTPIVWSKDLVDKVREQWRNLNIRSNHRMDQRMIRLYNIYDVSYMTAEKQDVEELFERKRLGLKMPLTQFMDEKYGIRGPEVQGQFPALKVSKRKEYYLPWGCCTTGPAARFSGLIETRLLQDQISPKSFERHGSIQDWIDDRVRPTPESQAYRIAERAFNVEIASHMVEVQPLLVPAPKMIAGGKKNLEYSTGLHRFAQYMQFVRGASIRNWAVLVFDNTMDRQTVKNWVDDIVNAGRKRGMQFRELTPFKDYYYYDTSYRAPQSTKRQKVRELMGQMMSEFNNLRPQGDLDLALCFMKQKMSPEYATLKYVGDVEHGVPTQVVLINPRTGGGGRDRGGGDPGRGRGPGRGGEGSGYPGQGRGQGGRNAHGGEFRQGEENRPNINLITNLLFKLNAKCGGQNFKFHDETARDLPLLRSSMLLGADVTHHGGSAKDFPSIAAVVGTIDADAVTYACRLSAQKPRQENIEALGGMVAELMGLYQNNTGRLPENILFFRDGLSETQFLKFLGQEGVAIIHAAESFGNYHPKIFIVVAIKRHHTRFFTDCVGGQGNAGRSTRPGQQQDPPPYNLAQGAVVDDNVTHPRDYDFYLYSHDANKGTGRPTHYYVLLDQINIPPDDLYRLVNHLCHIYQRCNKPVSLVTPVYYSHVAAFRAKHYMDYYFEEWRQQQDTGQQQQQQPPLPLPLFAEFNAHPRLRNHLWFV